MFFFGFFSDKFPPLYMGMNHIDRDWSDPDETAADADAAAAADADAAAAAAADAEAALLAVVPIANGVGPVQQVFAGPG